MVAALLFLLLILYIATFSIANVNIDCGTSTSSLDTNGIRWVGDQGFISSGLSVRVPSTTLEKSLTTLRYFPNGKSNCYTKIPVTRSGKVLVRTYFYYGNYDGVFSYPTFDVVFDGKYQSTITISSAFLAYYSEVIFVPTSGEISVCFIRTSSTSNPFVSSIEVADLAAGMYTELGLNEGFFIFDRLAYGATQGVRSDIYGRIWFPAPYSGFLTGPISTAALIDTSGSLNKPPDSVLRNCWTSNLLLLVDQRLPLQPVPAYFAMYFSEPLSFAVRSFNIYIDGKQINKVPVTPVFGKTTQVVVRDVMVSYSTQLTIVSTSSALHPAIINALELYVISKATSGGGGSGGGSGGSGGGGSGGGGSGPPAPGSGGQGSGGSPKVIEGKDSFAPIIIGVIVSLVCGFIVLTIVLCYCKHKTEPFGSTVQPSNGSTVQPSNGSTVQPSSGSTVQPPVGHMPTAPNTGTGQSAVNDTNRPPAYEPDEIDELIRVNDSFVPRLTVVS